MARPPGAGRRVELTAGQRRVAGWFAAALLIGVVALLFRILGGNGDGTVVNPSPSSSSGPAPSIRFGTAIDPATGAVADSAEVNRFAEGDLFAYSLEVAGAAPTEVFVEVRRTGGGPIEAVQDPIDAQPVPDPRIIAFQVPADALLAAFGPGRYEMLVYADPAAEALGSGRFELVGVTVSPVASP